VYVGLVHRLDQPTSGAVLLARTSKAAGRLTDQFRKGEVTKVYWAIIEGRMDEVDGQAQSEGEWVDYLEKDREANRVRVVADEGEGKIARATWRVLREGPAVTKLELRPSTGRSHQLRVQLAGRGKPILGDRKYGASRLLRADDGEYRIALHARELSFRHPTRGEVISIVAPVPEDWPESSRAWSGPPLD
jgi:23S rRNA pseudouridine1911/1915/1917 synthase